MGLWPIVGRLAVRKVTSDFDKYIILSRELLYEDGNAVPIEILLTLLKFVLYLIVFVTLEA
jgi:hypothetical protein